MGKYFGTDGFRGKAYDVVSVDRAYKVGRYIGFFSQLTADGTGKVIVGKDTRASSDDIEEAIRKGIRDSGADSYLMGITTTPALAYTVKKERFAYGLMITASHNPAEDNGIKPIDINGDKLSEDIIKKLEHYMDGRVDAMSRSRLREETVDYTVANDKYMEFIKAACPTGLEGLKVGVDCANGSAYKLAREVITRTGADVTFINDEPNGTNINENCGSTNIDAIRTLVLNNHLDVGFAFDGDGDRCIAVDSEGNIIDGDQLVYLFAKSAKEHGLLENSEVVITAVSNMGLVRVFEKLGINYHETPVGSVNVFRYMHQHECFLGGEESGHIVFGQYESISDGVLTALSVLKLMKETGKTLKELLKDYIAYPHKIVSIKVVDKHAVMEDPAITSLIDECKNALGSKGRILVRASGTESVIRIMSEAETVEDRDIYLNKLVDAVKTKYGK